MQGLLPELAAPSLEQHAFAVEASNASPRPSDTSGIEDSPGPQPQGADFRVAQKRLRERKQKLQAELDRVIEQDERRRKAREEEHQIRLQRLEKYKRIQTRAARSREMKRHWSPPLVAEAPVIRMPDAPRPDSAARSASEAARGRLRLRKQSEARLKRQNEVKKAEEMEKARKDREEHAEMTAKLTKLRLEQFSKAEHDKKRAHQAAEKLRLEDVRRRNEKSSVAGARLARNRVQSTSKLRRHEEQVSSERRAAQLQAKKEKAAAMEAEVLPRLRVAAAKRARPFLQIKNMEQEMARLRKGEKENQRKEALRQYSHPGTIREIKRKAAVAKSQSMLANEVVHNVVSEAVASVSTEYCSTGFSHPQLDDTDIEWHRDSSRRASSAGFGREAFLVDMLEQAVEDSMPLPPLEAKTAAVAVEVANVSNSVEEAPAPLQLVEGTTSAACDASDEKLGAVEASVTEPVVHIAEAPTVEVSTRLGPDLLSLMPEIPSNSLGLPKAAPAGGGRPAEDFDNVTAGVKNLAEPQPPKVAAGDVDCATHRTDEVSGAQAHNAATGSSNDAANGNPQPAEPVCFTPKVPSEPVCFTPKVVEGRVGKTTCSDEKSGFGWLTSADDEGA